MGSINKKKTIKNLKSKGYTDAPNKSNDHIYLEFLYEGKLICHTKISHGSSKDISGYLIGAMARQCLLKKSQFIDLAKCPMSKERYINVLKENGDID